MPRYLIEPGSAACSGRRGRDQTVERGPQREEIVLVELLVPDHDPEKPDQFGVRHGRPRVRLGVRVCDEATSVRYAPAYDDVQQ